MKKLLALSLSLVMILSLGACGASEEAVDQSGAKKPESSIRVGIVSSSSNFGDGAFNDMAIAGLDRAKEEFGIEYDKVGIKAVGDIELSIRDLATMGDYDLIIASTFEAVDAMKKVSAEFPEQQFALLDTGVEADNVMCYTTNDHEASFLVGVTAAMLKANSEEYGISAEKKLGFIGGVDAPNIRVFYSGYAAGAKYIDSEMVVMDNYVGGFADVTTAKEIASSMINQDADVIFHAAGMSGNGLFQAAKDGGGIAFGVNNNQNSVEPDYIAGSMIKNIDISAYNAVKAVVDGVFKGEIISLNLESLGVDMVTEGSNIILNEEILAKIEEIRGHINSGEIVVPKNAEELATFESTLG